MKSLLCLSVKRGVGTFQHVHEELNALLVADQRLLEAAAVVQLHCLLQDGDGGRLHPRHVVF